MTNGDRFVRPSYRPRHKTLSPQYSLGLSAHSPSHPAKVMWYQEIAKLTGPKVQIKTQFSPILWKIQREQSPLLSFVKAWYQTQCNVCKMLGMARSSMHGICFDRLADWLGLAAVSAVDHNTIVIIFLSLSQNQQNTPMQWSDCMDQRPPGNICIAILTLDRSQSRF